VLGALRALPQVVSELLHGEGPPSAPDRMGVRDLTELPASAGGWILLGKRPRQEIALGLVGKFWRPIIEYAELDADEFKHFDRPGYAKTIYALGVRPLGDRQTLLGVRCAPRRPMSTPDVGFAATGRSASARGHTFWSTDGLLDVVREDAESRAAR